METNASVEESPDPLVQRAAEGDEAALTVLLAANESALKAFIRSRWPTDYHAYADPDDLVQSTYVAAFESIGAIRARDRRGFRAWLMQLGHNRIRNMIREMRAGKRSHVRAQLAVGDDGAAGELLDLLCRSSQSPRSRAGEKEYIRLISDAMAAMPEDQKRVLRLRYLEQKDYPEIARITGKGHGAVRMASLRALKFLRGLLPGVPNDVASESKDSA